MILAEFHRPHFRFEWHLSLQDFWIGLRWERRYGTVFEATICPVPGCVLWFYWTGVKKRS